MLPGKHSVSESPATSEDALSAESDAKTKAGASRVTLVKSDQTDEEESMADNVHSTARPKVGRRHTVTTSANDALPEIPDQAPLEDARHELALKWDNQSARTWDVKFAVFLVALFAAVNIALVALVHDSHKSKTTSMVAVNKPAPVTTAAADKFDNLPALSPSAGTPAVAQPVLPAPVVAVASQPAPVAVEPPKLEEQSLPGAPHVSIEQPLPDLAQPPSGESLPAPAVPQAQAISATTPVPAVAPVVQQPPVASAPAAPAVTQPTHDSQQELLSILNKN